MKLIRLAAAAAAAGILLAGCSAAANPAPTATPAAAPPTTTAAPRTTASTTATARDLIIAGTVTLYGDALKSNTDCVPTFNYKSIEEGAEINVRDASDEIVATGTLGSGSSQLGYCFWAFAVDAIPAGSKTYSIDVGNVGSDEFDQPAVFTPGKTLVELTLGRH